MCRVTKLFMMRSYIIRGHNETKVQTRKLRWHGDVMRRDYDCVEIKEGDQCDSSGMQANGILLLYVTRYFCSTTPIISVMCHLC